MNIWKEHSNIRRNKHNSNNDCIKSFITEWVHFKFSLQKK